MPHIVFMQGFSFILGFCWSCDRCFGVIALAGRCHLVLGRVSLLLCHVLKDPTISGLSYRIPHNVLRFPDP